MRTGQNARRIWRERRSLRQMELYDAWCVLLVSLLTTASAAGEFPAHSAASADGEFPAHFAASAAGEFPAHSTAQLVAALSRFHHSGCVVLVHSPGRPAASILVQLARLLAERRVPTASLDVRTLETALEVLRCRHNRPLYVLLSGDDCTKLALSQVSQRGSLSHARWLLLSQGQGALGDYFRDVNVPFDCELLVAQPGTDGALTLSELYRISPSLPLTASRWGSWSPEDGLQGPKASLLRRRRNLQGHTLKAAARDYYPIISLRRGTGNRTTAGDFLGRVWTTLEDMFNFTTEYRDSGDSSWGLQLPGGSWNGLIGMLERGEAEVALNCFGMTPERALVGDYSQPLIGAQSMLYIQEPGPTRASWRSVVAPFSASLWLALIVAVPVLSAVLYIGRRVGAGSADTGPGSLHCMLAVFCQQGVYLPVLSPACHLVVWVGYLTALVVSTAYCSQLIAFRAVYSVSPPFNTWEQLLWDGTYRMGVIANSADYHSFQKSRDARLRAVFSQLLAPHEKDLPRTPSAGLHRVCRDARYAFLASTDMVRHAAPELSCRLLALPATAFQDDSAIIFRKHSPYRALLASGLADWRRSGALRLMLQHMSPLAPSPPRTPFSGVELGEVRAFHCLLATGVGAAVLSMLGECVAWRRCSLLQRWRQ